MGPDIETGAPGAAGSAAADRWLAALCMDRWCAAEAKRHGNQGRGKKPVAWAKSVAGCQWGEGGTQGDYLGWGSL